MGQSPLTIFKERFLLATDVETLDSATHRINHYPVDKHSKNNCFINKPHYHNILSEDT